MGDNLNLFGVVAPVKFFFNNSDSSMINNYERKKYISSSLNCIGIGQILKSARSVVWVTDAVLSEVCSPLSSTKDLHLLFGISLHDKLLWSVPWHLKVASAVCIWCFLVRQACCTGCKQIPFSGATPTIGNIHPFRKIPVPFEPYNIWCPLEFKKPHIKPFWFNLVVKPWGGKRVT